MTAPRLILASGSPRRRDLLEEAGYAFEVHPPDVAEREDADIEIRELTAWNARLKAEAVAIRFPEDVVIAADTLVLHRGEALGKPVDLAEAAKMLERLNGQTHHVFTAVCLVRRAIDREIEFAVSTAVTFRELTAEQRREYHALIDPLDKAGAYAAQDHGERIIRHTEGSFSNVVGLPMEELAIRLERDFAIRPQPS